MINYLGTFGFAIEQEGIAEEIKVIYPKKPLQRLEG